jgi:exodeoxyribonuclease VII large subunit
MAEIISEKKVFTLLEVTQSIQRTLAGRYKNSFWVKAEMNKLNHYTHSGHCYPDLVEKKNGKVVAQMRANLWKSDFETINAQFVKLLDEPLKDGINILFCANISFDPSYGLCLRIIDIDPSYSLGELEREKKETIEKLNSAGIFDQNKKLQLPLIPQRIAVISVETSKGFADYLKIIEHNPWGYKFLNMLFPALLQGDRSVASILAQLRRIKKVTHHFDAVAIIRGGGGDVGLSSYNNYTLAREIALFPLPVITGIGHSTNETVSEMVSFKNLITPTELADFLIQKFHNFSVPIKRAEELISEMAMRILRDEKMKLGHSVRYFQSVTANRLMKNWNNLNTIIDSLNAQARFKLKNENARLKNNLQVFKQQSFFLLARENQSINNIEKQISILNPINILKRGFTITLDKNGNVVTQQSQVRPGEKITTMLAEGLVVSEVTSVKKTDE